MFPRVFFYGLSCEHVLGGKNAVTSAFRLGSTRKIPFSDYLASKISGVLGFCHLGIIKFSSECRSVWSSHSKMKQKGSLCYEVGTARGYECMENCTFWILDELFNVHTFGTSILRPPLKWWYFTSCWCATSSPAIKQSQIMGEKKERYNHTSLSREYWFGVFFFSCHQAIILWISRTTPYNRIGARRASCKITRNKESSCSSHLNGGISFLTASEIVRTSWTPQICWVWGQHWKR